MVANALGQAVVGGGAQGKCKVSWRKRAEFMGQGCFIDRTDFNGRGDAGI